MSKWKDNGGPAFPLVIEEDGCLTQVHHGMTLRDWFAGQALVAIVQTCKDDFREVGEDFPQMFARKAYACADAMLEARGK